jgi:ribonuclease HI
LLEYRKILSWDKKISELEGKKENWSWYTDSKTVCGLMSLGLISNWAARALLKQSTALTKCSKALDDGL